MGECEIGAAASDVLELRFGLGQLKGDRVGYPKVGWSGSLASTVSVINRPDMFPPSATCRAFGPVSTPDRTTKTWTCARYYVAPALRRRSRGNT